MGDFFLFSRGFACREGRGVRWEGRGFICYDGRRAIGMNGLMDLGLLGALHVRMDFVFY